jgi:hypothetical protein
MTLGVSTGRLYFDLSSLLHHPLLWRVVPTALADVDEMAARTVAAVAARAVFRRRGKALRTSTLLRQHGPLLGRVLFRLVWSRPEGATAYSLGLMDSHLAQAEARLAAAHDPAG